MGTKGNNVKKKEFLATEALENFLCGQPEEITGQFALLVDKLENNGFLVPPYGKKIVGYENLFEIRILSGGSVRVFYCYQQDDIILGVSGFIKKSQKTPAQEIKKALGIIRQWEA